MTGIVLYGTPRSPPVRSCLLALKALEIPYEFKVVDLLKYEHLSEEFLKRNPQHTVPVLDDNGVWLWDSHVICSYLVGKYGKSDALYPTDLVQRAIVDQRMYFDGIVLYTALRNISLPLFRKQTTIVTKEKIENAIEGYEFLEKFLGNNSYVAGDHLTIADFCCCATVSSLRGIVPIDVSKFPKICAWLDRLSKLPYYAEVNQKGADDFIALVKSNITEIIL